MNAKEIQMVRDFERCSVREGTDSGSALEKSGIFCCCEKEIQLVRDFEQWSVSGGTVEVKASR